MEVVGTHGQRKGQMEQTYTHWYQGKDFVAAAETISEPRHITIEFRRNNHSGIVNANYRFPQPDADQRRRKRTICRHDSIIIVRPTAGHSGSHTSGSMRRARSLPFLLTLFCCAANGVEQPTPVELFIVCKEVQTRQCFAKRILTSDEAELAAEVKSLPPEMKSRLRHQRSEADQPASTLR
ncbi:hypothetical protein EVAR_63904_1 [Eumeta japonica]|uniref:Uncharacterized protein n=1 Tax=Eumeta variegata TaxID=151549 RepID=A0A4C1ZIE2_EUMVA|nr:hypothetical protein EVAR_63904_1 [Eumeta japonica]